jgi:hypothetical protein
MKRNMITALVLAGAMLMSAPVYASSRESETENATEGEDLIIGGADGPTDIYIVGGWDTNTGDTSIDAKENADAKKAYEKAFDGLQGDTFETIAFLGSQVVAGTNYCYLCRETSDEADPMTSYVLVYVYEDLKGNTQITDIKDIFPFSDDDASIEEYDETEEDDCQSVGDVAYDDETEASAETENQKVSK